jgi:hypothetical protein
VSGRFEIGVVIPIMAALEALAPVVEMLRAD